MDKIEFRLATTADKHAIADLLTLASPHLRPIKYWDWINTEKNFPGSFVVVAAQIDKIVGHYAISVREYSIFGIVKKVGIATQTVIHPSFRRLQILLDISNFLKDISLMRDLYMIIGFPNDNLYKINKKLLEWNHLADVSQLEVDLNQLPDHQSYFPKGRISEFDDKFCQLIEFNNMKHNNIREYLSIENLNWRYFEHPLHNYAVFTSLSDDAKFVNGYIVLKLYHSNIGLKGHVMEIVTFDDFSDMDLLFESAIGYFNWANCKSISLWSSKSDYKYNYFKKIGFKENSIQSYLQVLPLTDVNNKILNIDNWDLSMKMSDAY